jgi:ankyrin repeat protein
LVGRDETIKLLINRGIDVNRKDKRGKTALHTGW